MGHTVSFFAVLHALCYCAGALLSGALGQIQAQGMEKLSGTQSLLYWHCSTLSNLFRKLRADFAFFGLDLWH